MRSPSSPVRFSNSPRRRRLVVAVVAAVAVGAALPVVLFQLNPSASANDMSSVLQAPVPAAAPFVAVTDPVGDGFSALKIPAPAPATPTTSTPTTTVVPVAEPAPAPAPAPATVAPATTQPPAQLHSGKANVDCTVTAPVTGTSTGGNADCVVAGLTAVGVPVGNLDSAIRAYQTDQRLHVDGVAGPQTLRQLGVTFTPPPPPPPPPAPASNTGGGATNTGGGGSVIDVARSCVTGRAGGGGVWSRLESAGVRWVSIGGSVSWAKADGNGQSIEIGSSTPNGARCAVIVHEVTHMLDILAGFPSHSLAVCGDNNTQMEGVAVAGERVHFGGQTTGYGGAIAACGRTGEAQAVARSLWGI